MIPWKDFGMRHDILGALDRIQGTAREHGDALRPAATADLIAHALATASTECYCCNLANLKWELLDRASGTVLEVFPDGEGWRRTTVEIALS